MFKRISYTIALQFMGFIFLLLIVNGCLFLAIDFENVRRQSAGHLERTAHMVMERTKIGIGGFEVNLPPIAREQVRIVDESGTVLYGGDLFQNLPFSPKIGLSSIAVEDDLYMVLTTPIQSNGILVGYLQTAEISRLQEGDLQIRIALYLLVSGLISALTFGVGLFFARRSLRPAEQMVERLEQFTQDASHELRTPIAALSSSLDLALKNEKFREGIISAKDDLQQLSSIVERLLELARLDQFLLKTERIDLSALVEDTIERHRPLAAERGIVIESALIPGIWLQGDPSLLRQVVSNLLSNAIKFSKPEKGAIQVRLSKKTLEVEDHGIGIDKKDLPHIFHRFFQAEPSRAHGGYGLGLALVKRIVELHKWTISVASKLGKGTTVTIRFSSQE